MAKTSQKPETDAIAPPQSSGRKSLAKVVGKTKSKKQTCLDLLSRPKGASLDELQKATGWQAHSVRGFLSGTAKKLEGMSLVPEVSKKGVRRYHLQKVSA